MRIPVLDFSFRLGEHPDYAATAQCEAVDNINEWIDGYEVSLLFDNDIWNPLGYITIQSDDQADCHRRVLEHYAEVVKHIQRIEDFFALLYAS